MTEKSRCRQVTVAVLLLFLCSLQGCTVGPDYEKPDMAGVMQEGWESAEEAPHRFETSSLPAVSWWDQFNDDALSGLVRQLFSSGLALAQARERIVEANARYGVVEADRRLQLQAALGYTYVETGSEAVSLQGIPAGRTLDVFSTGVTAGWELDIWGRTGRLLEAAEEEIRAGYADYHYLMVSLAAELTLAYIEVRTIEARIANLQENISLQQRNLALVESRFQAGNGS